MHDYRLKVSFGDCDPAGIVFYPNVFRWMDAAFHDFLEQFGGHDALCRDLGAIGIGVMSSGCDFRAPMRNGERVTLRLTLGDPARRSIVLAYQGLVGERLVFESTERRALFVASDQGLSAGEVAPLLARMGAVG